MTEIMGTQSSAEHPYENILNRNWNWCLFSAICVEIHINIHMKTRHVKSFPTYLSKSRCTCTYVGEIKLLLCFQNEWSQFLWRKTKKGEKWNIMQYRCVYDYNCTVTIPCKHTKPLHHLALNIQDCIYDEFKNMFASLFTWEKTFIRIMLSNKNLLHTLHFADFLHNLKDIKYLIHCITFLLTCFNLSVCFSIIQHM